MTTAKLNVQHDYLTLRVKFDDGSSVNLTINRWGVKATGPLARGRRVPVGQILQAFEAWTKSTAGQGDTPRTYAAKMEAARAVAEASPDAAALVRGLIHIAANGPFAYLSPPSSQPQEEPMTVYLLISKPAFKVTTHADRRDAFTYVNQQCLDRGAYAAVGDAHDLPKDGSVELAAIAKSLKLKEELGESRALVYNALVSVYSSQPHEAIAPPPVLTSTRGAGDMDMETQTEASGKGAAKRGGSKGTAAKASAPKNTTRAPRGKVKPAGKVADFKQVKDGSVRATVLRLMDGTKTAEQIAAAGKVDGGAAKVMAHAFCLARDCGIGYGYGEGGVIKALYPGNKTIADAIKPAAAEKAKPAPKAAKAKPAKESKASASKAPRNRRRPRTGSAPPDPRPR